MLFRKVVVLLAFLCSCLPAFSGDVSDQFNVYQNSEGLIYLDNTSSDSNLPLGDQAEWLYTDSLQDKYKLNSQYDNYILSAQSLTVEVHSEENVPAGYAEIAVYKVFRGEFDGQEGEDFFVWIDGFGGLVFSPHANLSLKPLDTSSLNGELDLTKIGLFIQVKDINGDGVSDIQIVDDGQAFQFLGGSTGILAGTKSIDTSAVSEIPAKLSVTPSGAMTYSVPIEVPAGINGLQPNLSLNYNSRAGNGVMGVGWSIGGYDMFHRCGSNYEHDGKVKPITLTDEDHICFNGQRVFGDRTELDYFNEIKEIAGGYEVRTKGGLTKKYTHAIKLARAGYRGITYQWMLKTEKDRFGNEVNYEYDSSNGIAYLRSAEYSGGRLEFNYVEGRNDNVSKYLAGHSIQINKMLDSVELYVGDNKQFLKSEYKIDYAADSGAIFNEVHLDNISYCTFDEKGGKQCVPSIAFDWQENDLVFETPKEKSSTLEYTMFSQPLDWNGDGIMDLLVLSKNKLIVKINDGSKFIKDELVNVFDPNERNISSIIVGDFYNRGKDAILYRSIHYLDGIKKQRQVWNIKYNNSINSVDYNFTLPGIAVSDSDNVVLTEGMNPLASPRPAVLDIDGDGVLDFILPRDKGWYISKFHGSRWSEYLISHKIADLDKVSSIVYAGKSTDGNHLVYFLNTEKALNSGKYDLKMLNDNGYVIKSISTDVLVERSLMLDVNDDGLVDILSAGEAGSEKDKMIGIYINNGNLLLDRIETSINASEVLPSGNGSIFPATHPSKIADVNNDGLSDVIYHSQGRYKCLISNGAGFSEVDLGIEYLGDFFGAKEVDVQNGCSETAKIINEIDEVIDEVNTRRRFLATSKPDLNSTYQMLGYSNVASSQSESLELLKVKLEKLKGVVIVESDCYECNAINIGKSIDSIVNYKKTINTLSDIAEKIANNVEGISLAKLAFNNTLNLLEPTQWTKDGTDEISVLNALNYARCSGLFDSPANLPAIGASGYHISDLTGDGVVDLLQLSGETSTDWMVWENKSKNDLINKISTAFNKDTNKKAVINKDIDIKYTTKAISGSAEELFYDRTKVVKEIKKGLDLVANVIVSSDRFPMVLSNYDYKYGAFKFHTRGRGFLGTNEYTVENKLTGGIRATNYHQEFPFIGLKHKIESRVTDENGGEKLIKGLDLTWNKKPSEFIDETGSKHIKFTRFTPLMKASLSSKYDLDGKLINSETVEYTNYDDYGNNLQKLSKLWGRDDFTVTDIPAAGFLSSKAVENVYPLDLDNWLISNKSNSTELISNASTNGENLSSRDITDRSISYEYLYHPDSLSVSRITTKYDDKTESKTWNGINNNGVIDDSGSSGTNFTGERLIVNKFLNNQYPSEIRSYGYNATKFIKYDPVLFKPNQITDFDGKTSHIDYDAFGREIETISGDGIVTTTRYISCEDEAACQRSPEASYKVTVDSGGLPSTEVYYDKLNREILSRTQLQFDQNWQSVETKYTPEGYLSRTSLPYLGNSATHWTTYTNYDALGRVGLVTRPDGGSTATEYSTVDGQQRVQVTETVVPADGPETTRVVQSFFDARGLLVKKIEAVGSDEEIIMEFDYDAMGNRDWVRVGGKEEETTTSIFDNAGNLVQLNDPSTGISKYTYAANGDLLTQLDAKKQLLTYTYDLFSRPKTLQEGTHYRAKKTYWYYDNNSKCNSGGAPQTYQTYVGKVCREYSIYDSVSKYYRYDSRGNLAHTKLLVDNKTSNYHARYDKYNRLESERLDSGITLNYNYQNGYLNSVIHQDKPLWEATEEDEFGNVTAYNLGNSLNGLNSYDPMSGRLSGLSVGLESNPNSIQSNQYQWNSDGTLYSREWQKPSPQTETFGYDAQKRLTEVTSKNAIRYSRNYGYELNGNIKSKTEIAGDLVYGGKDVGPYAVSKAGDVSYHYDENGNITLRDPDGAGAHAGHKIEYNLFNKPTSIEDDKGKTLFSYGTDLSRNKQVRLDNGTVGLTTYYVNGGRVEKRYSPSDSVLEQITYIGDFAQLTEYGTLEAYENNTQSQTWNYLHRDHLGSIEAITDENGAIAVSEGKPQYFSYDAFGQPRAELGEISTRGFTDHEHLTESGLIHMNGRVYDPLISRFLSADIMVQAPDFSQSYNRYSYVWNNPLSLYDPSGYAAVLLFTPEVIGFFSGIGLSINLDFEINDGGGFRSGILDNPIQDFSSPPHIYVPHEGESYSILTNPIVVSVAVAYIRYSAALDQIFSSNPEGFQAAENTGPVVMISEGSSKEGVVTNKVDLNLKYKEGWTSAQKAAADVKCQALCDAITVVTQAERSGTSASSRYKRAGNTVSPGNDVDHVVDLQLGGADSVSNMQPLNSSVNRSLGIQIYHQIKNLPAGTVIDKVNIR